jgi:hypothetical protein
MKKLIVLIAVILSLSAALFAEDASTLPAKVGRFYIVPAYAFANDEFDDGLGSHSIPDGSGSYKAFSLSFALEYGINDWISIAARWAPAWTTWSEVDLTDPSGGLMPPAAFTGTEDVNGLSDLFVGAKVQIVGAKAPVKTHYVRLALAPGVKIPMPGHDFGDTVTDILQGKGVTVQDADKHAIGIGAQFYFDWIINKMFFINLFNETIFYPFKTDIYSLDLALAAALGGQPATPAETLYGYEVKCEIEGRFEKQLTRGLLFKAGIPFTWKYAPSHDITSKIDGSFLADAKSTSTLTVGPNVGVLLTGNAMPLEFVVQYNYPIVGKSAKAQHSVTLSAKVYFALPGALD